MNRHIDMKRLLPLLTVALMLPALLLWVGCASAGKGGKGKGPQTLDAAVGLAAAEIVGRLPAGAAVAVLEFKSPTARFSNYVIAEMEANLLESGNVTVIDRKNIDIIVGEQTFQMSGEVSDETIQDVGQKLGAQFIITGYLTGVGGAYRLTVRALNVETAVVAAQYAGDVGEDNRVAALLRVEPIVAPAKPAAGEVSSGAGESVAADREAGTAGADFTEELTGIQMIFVAGGTFTMGGTKEQMEPAHQNDMPCFGSNLPTRPTHDVTLGSYYIGKYPVTRRLWTQVMGGRSPSTPVADDDDEPLAVDRASWNDAQEFIKRLNEKTGMTFRLPTEAEWEFAARGGTKTQVYRFSGSNNPGEVAWHSRNSERKIRPIGLLKANELGIHDMNGNVWEWVNDWAGPYTALPKTDPQGPLAGNMRVKRGGAWYSSTDILRPACRSEALQGAREDGIGFRLALTQPPPARASGAGRSNAAPPPAEARTRQQRPSKADVAEQFEEQLAMRMVDVDGGTFRMGCTNEQTGNCEVGEYPARSVTLTDYSIGAHEVTQRQWKLVMGDRNNPSAFKGDSLPVENVNWNDVSAFIAKLNGMTGRRYRLPTEAEWEYAARGGNRANREQRRYSGSDTIDAVAWYIDNDATRPVGRKRPNHLGIYDMSGNVWEWVGDLYGDYTADVLTNPLGPETSADGKRVVRGGGWSSAAGYCRVSSRGAVSPNVRDNNLGFRLALTRAPKTAGPASVPKIDMVPVKGATFTMGSPDSRTDPASDVTLSDFSIGKHEVTQRQWKQVMGAENDLSEFEGDDLPVQNVSWNDAQMFIKILNELTGKRYRLPTEAEWEFAARGGKSGEFKYSGGDNIGDVGWYHANSGDTMFEGKRWDYETRGGLNNRPRPVGSKRPNELGIYDMTGNMRELVNDWHGKSTGDSKIDPTGPEPILRGGFSSSPSTRRVIRGGSWNCKADECLVLERNAYYEPHMRASNTGFRLAHSRAQQTAAKLPAPPAIEMVSVKGGTFTKGCTPEQEDARHDCYGTARPTHKVTVSDFGIGKYEITQGQWRQVMGRNIEEQYKLHMRRVGSGNDLNGVGDNIPIYYVALADVEEFILKLNRLTGKTYRLPTSAEWEFAARGGNMSRGYRFAGSNNADSVAWHFEGMRGKRGMQPVGGKRPNELGIYDMSGNAEEIVIGAYGYTASARIDPMTPALGVRGGSSGGDRAGCMVSSSRDGRDLERGGSPFVGFRIAQPSARELDAAPPANLPGTPRRPHRSSAPPR